MLGSPSTLSLPNFIKIGHLVWKCEAKLKIENIQKIQNLKSLPTPEFSTQG